MRPSNEFYVKLAERVFWTAAQAGLAVVITALTGISAAWVAPVATLLAVVKGFVARKVGDPQSPATLPWGIGG